MISDASIAKKVRLKDIEDVAKEFGIPKKYVEPWGRYKAKINLKFLRSVEHRHNGKYIVVSAITPTPLGEGKTVTSIGLSMALNKLGRPDEAMECYNKALQIDPSHEYAKNNKDSLVIADTTPPPVMSNLIAADDLDGKVILSWDKSTAADFGYYNIYISQSMMTDVTGMTPNDQIKEIDRNTYQAVGLKLTTKYYFAVTAVDKSGNEKPR